MNFSLLVSNSAVAVCSNPHARLALGNIETYGTASTELPAVEIFCIAGVFYCGFTFFPFLTSTVSKINFPDLRVLRAAGLKFHILLLWLFLFYYEIHETG